MYNLFDEEFCQDEVLQTAVDLLQSSSEEDEAVKWGGSRPCKRANIDRGRESGAMQLYKDYFSSDAVYPDHIFERRFRLTRNVFLEIRDKMEVHDVYFTQRMDCTGRMGLTSLQKITATLRLLAYGSAADSVDEYIRMGESTALMCLDHFAEGIVELYKNEYLRAPTNQDIKMLLAREERLGFPGMLGSIDCCKWEWKNCPVALHGQFQGKEGVPTITLEAIADDRLWIWHAFFGLPGCLNDINVLRASPLSNKIDCTEYPPPVEYTVDSKRRRIPYWLADGIYPQWSMFLQTIAEPVTPKKKLKWKAKVEYTRSALPSVGP